MKLRFTSPYCLKNIEDIWFILFCNYKENIALGSSGSTRMFRTWKIIHYGFLLMIWLYKSNATAFYLFLRKSKSGLWLIPESESWQGDSEVHCPFLPIYASVPCILSWCSEEMETDTRYYNYIFSFSTLSH